MSKAELEAMKAMVRAMKENEGTKALSESTKHAQARKNANKAAFRKFTHWGMVENALEKMQRNARGGARTRRGKRRGTRRGTRRA